MPSDPQATSPQQRHSAADVPAVDGVTPRDVVAPSSPTEVAEILADAAERGIAVAPVGGATALGLGNVPERLDLALSTANLGGIIDYEPTDLVLSAGAGARFGDILAVLAEHGQTIPLDAPHAAEATLGGLIATALSSPRRLGSGSLRDLLIGISVAHPSGTVTKAGGMVVKNVSGFDLTRLYHGSLGTLGVIVSANFKVLPLPATETTILASYPFVQPALYAADRVRASRFQPTSLEVASLDGDWRVAVRVEGRHETVGLIVRELQPLLGETALIEGPASTVWWRNYVDLQAPTVSSASEVVIRCGRRPRETAGLVHLVQDAAQAQGGTIRTLQASPGLGTVIARIDLAGDDPGTSLSALQGRLLDQADTATILAAVPELKRDLDVWGKPPETLDVMRALKDQFDPARVLNPGRFSGRI